MEAGRVPSHPPDLASSLQLLPPQVEPRVPGAPSAAPGPQRPLAPAEVCPPPLTPPLLSLPQDSAFVLTESRAPPRPGHLPQGVPASRSPQNGRRFPEPIPRFQKFQFRSSLPSPAPRGPALLDPGPSADKGKRAGGQGCSSPGFSPGPSCSHGCLEILERLPERRPAPQAGRRAPPAGRVRERARRLGRGVGRGGSPDPFGVPREGSSWSQPQPFQPVLEPDPAPLQPAGLGGRFRPAGPSGCGSPGAHAALVGRQSCRAAERGCPAPAPWRPGSCPGRSPLPARGCLGDACMRWLERGSRGDFPAGVAGRPA